MDLAGKTNAAFVFIKPHACNEKVIYFPTSNLASAKGCNRLRTHCIYEVSRSAHPSIFPGDAKHFLKALFALIRDKDTRMISEGGQRAGKLGELPIRK